RPASPRAGLFVTRRSHTRPSQIAKRHLFSGIVKNSLNKRYSLSFSLTANCVHSHLPRSAL
ncbi:hypothetical protein, partial [Pseudomonas ficuserectae]|uniref:hypothetical protein n=1 Tax=Pseudomonas ficuserectae TaxID=53410 RepID=UPI001C3F2AAE